MCFFFCRWCHSHIDNFYSPIDGHQLSSNEHWYWWVRIRYNKTWSYDEGLDYEDLYFSMAEQKEDIKRKDVMSWW